MSREINPKTNNKDIFFDVTLYLLSTVNSLNDFPIFIILCTYLILNGGNEHFFNFKACLHFPDYQRI